jgi:hypothetical protein
MLTAWYMVIIAAVKNAIIPVCSCQQHHQSLQYVLVSRKPLYWKHVYATQCSCRDEQFAVKPMSVNVAIVHRCVVISKGRQQLHIPAHKSVHATTIVNILKNTNQFSNAGLVVLRCSVPLAFAILTWTWTLDDCGAMVVASSATRIAIAVRTVDLYTGQTGQS